MCENGITPEACQMMFDEEIDLNKKAFWLYTKLLSLGDAKESDLDNFATQYSNAVFPDKQYLESITAKGLDYGRPGSKILFYFCMEIPYSQAEKFIHDPVHQTKSTATLTDIQVLKKYYLKAIDIYEKEKSPEKGMTEMYVNAYAFLFNLECDVESPNVVCDLTTKILSETPNIQYCINNWGVFGYLHYDALSYQLKNCSPNLDETKKIFERIFLENIGDGASEHAQGFRPYINETFQLLNKYTREDQLAIANPILENPKINRDYKRSLCLHLAALEIKEANYDQAKGWCEKYITYINQEDINPPKIKYTAAIRVADERKKLYDTIKNIVTNGFDPEQINNPDHELIQKYKCLFDRYLEDCSD